MKGVFGIRTDGFSFCNGITYIPDEISVKPEVVCLILNKLMYYAGDSVRNEVLDMIYTQDNEELTEDEIKTHWMPVEGFYNIDEEV